MSEQAKTIAEAYNESVEKYEGAVAMTLFHFLGTYGGLHIIPGADAVVTEEGLETVGHALYENAAHPKYRDQQVPWEELDENTKGMWLLSARAAFEAAGMVVAERVVRGYLIEVDGMVFVTDGQRDTTSLGSLSGTTISIAVLPEKGK